MPPDAQATRWWVTEDDVVSLWHDRASWRWWIMVNVRVEPVRMVVRERGGFDVLVDLDGETRYLLGWGGRLERTSDGMIWEAKET